MLVTKDNYDKALESLSQDTIFVLDTETTGFKILEGDDWGCGIGIIGLTQAEDYYFPFRQEGYEGNLIDRLPEFMSFLSKQMKTIINANLKFDMRVLIKDGLTDWVDMELHDLFPMVRLWSKDKFPQFDLNSLIRAFYGESHVQFDIEFKTYLKKNKLKRFSQAPVDMISHYCCKQIIYTMGIYQSLTKILKDAKQQKIWDLEIKTTKALLEMELAGVSIDLEYCKWAIDELKAESKEYKKKAYDLVGKEFNMGSPKQVAEVFNSLGIHSPRKTPKGAEAWGDEVITLLDNPLASTIREIRTFDKLLNTYFEPFYASGGMINCSFSNWKTITGRLSCSKPNLQNIPRFWKILGEQKSEESEKKRYIQQMMAATAVGVTGKTIGGSSSSSWAFTGDESYDDSAEHMVAVRRAFIAPSQYKLYSFDFSQMEIRVLLTYISGGKEVLELMAGSDKFDFHSFMAKRIYSIDDSHKDFKFFRQLTKGITFGLIYGMGLNTMAASIGKSKEEAKELRDAYFDKLEGIKEFIKEVQAKIGSRGYVFNRYHRKYYLQADKAYVGVNYLIQGMAADLVKEQMVKVVDFLRDYNSRCLIQIHDELVISIHDDEELLIPKIVNILEDNIYVPLKVDVAECSPSWAHKKDYKVVTS